MICAVMGGGGRTACPAKELLSFGKLFDNFLIKMKKLQFTYPS
jgi:hypothetical protein